ncbi:MFS transporter [Spirillospora sp. NPDC127200]
MVMITRTPLVGWLAVGAVAAATFSVVTTEMLPVGLLTAMAGTFGVSTGTAGLAMTLPGVVAAVAAPALAAAAGRRDRRPVLVALVALLAAADLVSALAPGFGLFLAARVLVGVSIGGVWAMAAGLGGRLVPERSAGAATSVIFSGIAVASVLGVPAGTLVGGMAGWRAAFGAMAALAAVVAVALAVLLPPLPVAEPVRLRAVPGLLRVRRVRTGLLATFLLVTGHFAAYTYVRPALEQVAGVGAGLVGALLLAYGVAGVAGNFAAGAGAARNLDRTVLAISGALVVSVALLPLSGPVAMVAWGLAYGGVSVTLQSWLLAAVPRAPEAGSALFVAAFNIAISLGALVGGRVVDGAGVAGVLWACGLLAALGGISVARAR